MSISCCNQYLGVYTDISGSRPMMQMHLHAEGEYSRPDQGAAGALSPQHHYCERRLHLHHDGLLVRTHSSPI